MIVVAVEEETLSWMSADTVVVVVATMYHEGCQPQMLTESVEVM